MWVFNCLSSNHTIGLNSGYLNEVGQWAVIVKFNEEVLPASYTIIIEGYP